MQQRAEHTPVLTVRGLGFYARGAAIIDNLDVTLDGDETTVIMGPNGAGKSVLLRLLHGLLTPGQGEIEWFGAPLNATARRTQALVFQRPVLLRRSALDNVVFVLETGRKQARERALQLLAQVGLEASATAPARSLSGGEQQRLALARALALEPRVLLLDEPTASLDPASTALFEQLVNRVGAAGIKVVMVTHDQGQARRMGDEVVFMHRGRVVEHSPAESFFNGARTRAARDYLEGRLLL